MSERENLGINFRYANFPVALAFGIKFSSFILCCFRFDVNDITHVIIIFVVFIHVLIHCAKKVFCVWDVC